MTGIFKSSTTKFISGFSSIALRVSTPFLEVKTVKIAEHVFDDEQIGG